MDEADATIVSQLRDHAARALESHRQRVADGLYETMVQQMATADAVLLRRWLLALQYVASSVTAECEELLFLVFSSEAETAVAWAADVGVAAALCEFAVHLVSANGTFVEPVYASLVEAFSPADSDDMPAEEVLDVVHAAILEVLRIFPGSAPNLATVLRRNFPHKSHELGRMQGFVRNLLRICAEAPDGVRATLVERSLGVVVDVLVKMDVEIMITAQPEPAADDGGGMFDLEEEEGADEGEAGGSGGVALAGDDAASREMAIKLDVLMSELLPFVATICEAAEGGEAAARVSFGALLSAFEAAILTTYRCKFVQFIMLVSCAHGQAHNLSQLFVDRLLAIVCDEQQSANKRHAAAAYLGSYVARATILTTETIRSSVQRLAEWAVGYIERLDVQGAEPDAVAHATFYAVCQALMYTVCFKGEWLLGRRAAGGAAGEVSGATAAAGRAFLRSLDVRRIVSSRFNPLLCCLPDVVSAFVRMTARNGILECESILESNRELARRGGDALRWGRSNGQELDTFFPFDPYVLGRVSEPFLEGLYQEYDAGEDSESEEESAEDDSSQGASSTPSHSQSEGGRSMPSSAEGSFQSRQQVVQMLQSPI